jgi:hypothetical protein
MRIVQYDFTIPRIMHFPQHHLKPFGAQIGHGVMQPNLGNAGILDGQAKQGFGVR